MRSILNKKHKTMFCTTVTEGSAESAQITRELGPHWDRYRTRLLSGDLSRMMRTIVAGRGAISLRREGGLYFVPLAQRPALERLRGLLAALPHRAGQEPQLCALGCGTGPKPAANGPRRCMVRSLMIWP